ncbi:PREDICTED: syntaxin-binding protein 6 [Chinchilla lanigera]|nr:PREDICTED: syntaxin-binding protein 6 [Chinchilla lanigera]
MLRGGSGRSFARKRSHSAAGGLAVRPGLRRELELPGVPPPLLSARCSGSPPGAAASQRRAASPVRSPNPARGSPRRGPSPAGTRAAHWHRRAPRPAARKFTAYPPRLSTMSAKSAISKEIFAPLDERMLGAVQVRRRTKKKIPFLATGGQGEYLTYICLSVTNKKPTQASITKVKQFEGSTSFVRRSQWMLEQLRQVNGIDPNRDSAEFDLLFENAFDQWVASTASEKCTFFQILHHTCQRYLTDRKPEFINCQSKIMGGNSILHSAADSVTSAVQKASQALNERGERLGRAEEKTEDMKNSAQQFAETAHKLAMKHKC